MPDQDPNPAEAQLEPFIGRWQMTIAFPGQEPIDDARATTSFDWMPGGWFLIERTEIPGPVPNGVSVIGYDKNRETLLQHYFDSRGVARVYEMTIEDGVWALSRTKPDFSPLDFSQRYTGEFSDEGKTIAGKWEIRHPGKDWELDFGLDYKKVG